jgi:hypothetical protein
MPKAKAVARNGDQNPNAYDMMPDVDDMPVENTPDKAAPERSGVFPAFKSTLSLKNSIRDKNTKG